MAGFFTWFWDWLLWVFWATEMDVTIVGLQNAGKTSLLRVLAVRTISTGGYMLEEVADMPLGERIYHRHSAHSCLQ